MTRDTYGRWWRGQVSFSTRNWRFSFVQDLLSLQVGAGLGLGGFQIYLGPWSLWVYSTKRWVDIAAPNPIVLPDLPSL